jgi:hypothetical protein
MKRALNATLLLAASMLTATHAGAIVNGTPPGYVIPEVQDTRFDAIGAFATTWRLGLEPTHPEASDHDWFCTATLVDNHTVMLAKHCTDPYTLAAPYAVRFRRNLKGGIGTKEKGVKSYYHARIASWIVPAQGDVVLGLLQTTVQHIAPIPLLPLDGSIEVGPNEPAIIGGWGKEGPGPGEGPRNQLLLCDTWVTGMNPFSVQFPPFWDPAGPGCGVNNNDSGAPVLLESPFDGAVRVLGVVSSFGSGTNLALYTGQKAFESRVVPWWY